jgi:flavin-binding protein dodecin
MKLYVSHTESERVKDIVAKLVEAAGSSVLVEKPDLDKDLVDEIVKNVKMAMAKTMAVLLLGSSSTIIEYDIENAVGQAFENIAKMVKWELEQEQGNDEKIDNVDHQQV